MEQAMKLCRESLSVVREETTSLQATETTLFIGIKNGFRWNESVLFNLASQGNQATSIRIVTRTDLERTIEGIFGKSKHRTDDFAEFILKHAPHEEL